MTNIKGNALIAEFLGWDKASQEVYFVPNLYPETKYSTGHTTFHTSEMQFEKRWDFLIPVVEKIESIEDPHHGYFGVHIASNGCTIQGTKFRSDKINNPPIYYSDFVLDSKIEATWQAVVEFIQWYNNQTPTPTK